MSSDQRKWPRVRPTGMIFAVIGDPQILVGQIIDISPVGLAFKHFSDRDVDRQDFTVGIIESGGGLRVSDLPCRKIYDLLESLPEGYLNFNLGLGLGLGWAWGRAKLTSRYLLIYIPKP